MVVIARCLAVIGAVVTLTASGGQAALAQSGTTSCSACKGCAEIIRFTVTGARTFRRLAAEARRNRRGDLARSFNTRARRLDERRGRALADLRACQRNVCGAATRPGRVFLQCVVRPNLSGRWRSGAVRCPADGRHQIIRVRDQRPSYRLKITAEACPRPGAVVFDKVVGPTRFFISSQARSAAGRLVFRREDLVIVDAGRIRLRAVGRPRAVRYTRLPRADLAGAWQILQPAHLAGSLVRIEQAGAKVVGKHVRPAPETARLYGFEAGQSAFRGTLEGKVLKGRLRSRFPRRLGVRCPDKLVRARSLCSANRPSRGARSRTGAAGRALPASAADNKGLCGERTSILEQTRA